MQLINKNNVLLYVGEAEDTELEEFLNENPIIKDFLDFTEELKTTKYFSLYQKITRKSKRIKELEELKEKSINEKHSLCLLLLEDKKEERDELSTLLHDEEIDNKLSLFGLDSPRILNHLHDRDLQKVLLLGDLTKNDDIKAVIDSFSQSCLDFEDVPLEPFMTSNPELYKKILIDTHPVIIVENFKNSMGFDSFFNQNILRIEACIKRGKELDAKRLKLNKEFDELTFMRSELNKPTKLGEKFIRSFHNEIADISKEQMKLRDSIYSCMNDFYERGLDIKYSEIETFFERKSATETEIETQTNFVFTVLEEQFVNWLTSKGYL